MQNQIFINIRYRVKAGTRYIYHIFKEYALVIFLLSIAALMFYANTYPDPTVYYVEPTLTWEVSKLLFIPFGMGPSSWVIWAYILCREVYLHIRCDTENKEYLSEKYTKEHNL